MFETLINFSLKIQAGLKNEIEILRKINHPNLIKLNSVYKTTNSYCLVFELFSGGNLKKFVQKNGVLSETQAAFILRSILEGLAYLHSVNIMHRDIKPENILFRNPNLTDKNQIVLADFGLATSNDVPEYLYFRCGTPGYVAPEILNASCPLDRYDVKCDMFSLGVTLFYVLTGFLPYPRKRELIQENMECKFEFENPGFKKLSDSGW